MLDSGCSMLVEVNRGSMSVLQHPTAMTAKREQQGNFKMEKYKIDFESMWQVSFIVKRLRTGYYAENHSG